MSAPWNSQYASICLKAFILFLQLWYALCEILYEGVWFEGVWFEGVWFEA